MTALIAILVDTYRELASKRLFWLSMALSGLVVLSFALIGINEKGMSILGWTLEIPFINSTLMDASDFYKLAFYALGVRFWLAWLACLLALVASAGLFPELVSSGTVETLLARPIARWRLYVFKFTGGLLFTALQVMVFCTASFVVIGVRGGAWEPGLFLAVPMVALLYSYLFSVCALIGTVTRSGIAALLLTVLFWGFLFTLNTSEQMVNSFRIAKIEERSAIDRLMDTRRQKDANADVSDLEQERQNAEDAIRPLTTAHRILLPPRPSFPRPTKPWRLCSAGPPRPPTCRAWLRRMTKRTIPPPARHVVAVAATTSERCVPRSVMCWQPSRGSTAPAACRGSWAHRSGSRWWCC
jgi:ABC-type transport system involved in multi-copper enzyme maturation permease subunit